MTIEEAVWNLPQGWPHHIVKMIELLEKHRPHECVELGTWRGASAIAMARILRQWGGILYCVDAWTGDVNGSWTDKPGYPTMIAECAAAMITADVAASVRLIPSTTRQAALCWPKSTVDCLYVDADHSFESTLQDLVLWWPHLRHGGLVMGDDYANPIYPGVKRAWDQFEDEYQQPFERFYTLNTSPPNMPLIWGIKL